MTIKTFRKQTGNGRNLVVGDIHGHFSKLKLALDRIGFDPARGDRLFSVGDLVDRGPESADVLDWLAQPWFHAVQGNHEDMAYRWGKPGSRMDPESYALNGGAWNIGNTPPERLVFSDALGALPLAIEIETDVGLVGIVHADCPFKSWDDLKTVLTSQAMKEVQRLFIRRAILWSRERIEAGDESGVKGLLALFVGHTPVVQPVALGNVVYVDTGAWLPDGGDFTIIDIATRLPATCRAAQSEEVAA